MPENVFRDEDWYNESEELRSLINEWIRNQKESDGVIDFDAIAHSADNIGELREGFHLDDLHPGEAGGREMAFIVPLEEITGDC